LSKEEKSLKNIIKSDGIKRLKKDIKKIIIWKIMLDDKYAFVL
jgi:hypothetical protein